MKSGFSLYRIVIPLRLLLSIVCFTLFDIASAQPTHRYMTVDSYPYTSLPKFLTELKEAGDDTSKANLLLRIGSIYYLSETKPTLDSVIHYARLADGLSKSLKYLDGHTNAAYLLCRAFMKKEDFNAAKSILKDVYGETYILILLALSEYYVNNRDAGPAEIRKAYPYLVTANRLSKQQMSRHWMTESSIAEAKFHFRLAEITKGKDCFMRVIQYQQQIGDKAQEARWWLELGRYTPDSDSSYALEINSFEKARGIFEELGDQENVAECLFLAGYCHSFHNRPDLTEKFYLAELETLKAAGINKSLPQSYQKLSVFYQRQNDLDKALRFALMGVKSLKSTKDHSQYDGLHMTLGSIYASMGDHATSIKHYKLVFQSIPVHRVYTYNLLKLLVIAYLKVGRPEEGLSLLKSFVNEKVQPKTAANKQLVAFLFGQCYAAIGDFNKAEKYYLEMIRFNEVVEYSERSSWGTLELIAGAEAYSTIGKFYTDRGRYNQADAYLKKALGRVNLTPALEMNTRYLMFKVDSSRNDYLSSIRNFQRYIFLKDSLGNVTKDKSLSIFKASLKEKENQLLQNEALLQKRQLELSARTEKFTYSGIVALLCLLGLLFNRYRLKQNKNLQLEEQQKTINIKNSSLIRLVNEKEWLLKEVHHRVKNNLQIVISLLNSQSAYLKEDVAVNAILESRHRIQAMSMLHQRIYQSQNTSGISMPSYIHELVYYLNDSFNLGKRIIFHVDVDDIQLDLVQAVPVGLILNEAITNSLKYAFPDPREGEINVSFKKSPDGNLLLVIADNGVGLCLDFKIEEIKSFGLKLIKGLTEDLEGDFTITGRPGTTLLIEFEYKPVMGSHQQDLKGIEI